MYNEVHLNSKFKFTGIKPHTIYKKGIAFFTESYFVLSTHPNFKA